MGVPVSKVNQPKVQDRFQPESFLDAATISNRRRTAEIEEGRSASGHSQDMVTVVRPIWQIRDKETPDYTFEVEQVGQRLSIEIQIEEDSKTVVSWNLLKCEALHDSI